MDGCEAIPKPHYLQVAKQVQPRSWLRKVPCSTLCLCYKVHPKYKKVNQYTILNISNQLVHEETLTYKLNDTQTKVLLQLN